MNSSLVAQAMEQIRQRRLLEDIALEQRLDEITLKVPEVMEARNQLAQTSAKLGRLIFTRGTDIETGVAKIRDENLALQEKERVLLRQNGYPEDYLRPHRVCVDCEDTGYRDGVRCHCVDALVRQLALQQLNQVSSLKLTGFDNFRLDYYPTDPEDGRIPRKWMERVLHYCQEYARTFQPDMKGLLMQGNTGLGKTHLSLAIATGVIRRGFGVVYGSTQDFLRVIEKEHFGRAAQPADTLDGLLAADLLILDDLGAEFSTQFTQSVIYNILNTRISQNRPTIVSTNLSRSELEEKYGQRVVSRLYTQLTCLRFVGRDIRQLKSQM